MFTKLVKKVILGSFVGFMVTMQTVALVDAGIKLTGLFC